MSKLFKGLLSGKSKKQGDYQNLSDSEGIFHKFSLLKRCQLRRIQVNTKSRKSKEELKSIITSIKPNSTLIKSAKLILATLIIYLITLIIMVAISVVTLIVLKLKVRKS